MRRRSMRHRAVHAQARYDDIGQAILYWFPAGFGFAGLILHIFPKSDRVPIGSPRLFCLEPISKMHLTASCGVAHRLNLLIYRTVCCAVSATGALPAAVIRYF
jgi:hypothetical protein